MDILRLCAANSKLLTVGFTYLTKCTYIKRNQFFLFVLKLHIQGFQYFSSVPVLHYLQAVLFIEI